MLESQKSSDLGGSKKEIFLTPPISEKKNGVKSKGSSRQFQQRSFHLKLTPYEKVIAFCFIDKTSKFGTMGLPRGIHTVWTDDMEVVWIDMWQYGLIKMQHVSCTDDEVEI